MTATTIVIDKGQAAALAGPPTADRAAILVKVGRKVPAIGETVQLKAGKAILAGVVVATAQIAFTPIALRRVLDLRTGGEVGDALGRVLTAAEQGASQAAQHLEILADLTGYGAWSKAFDAAQATPDKADQPLDLTRQLVAVANLKAVA